MGTCRTCRFACGDMFHFYACWINVGRRWSAKLSRRKRKAAKDLEESRARETLQVRQLQNLPAPFHALFRYFLDIQTAHCSSWPSCIDSSPQQLPLFWASESAWPWFVSGWLDSNITRSFIILIFRITASPSSFPGRSDTPKRMPSGESSEKTWKAGCRCPSLGLPSRTQIKEMDAKNGFPTPMTLRTRACHEDLKIFERYPKFSCHERTFGIPLSNSGTPEKSRTPLNDQGI